MTKRKYHNSRFRTSKFKSVLNSVTTTCTCNTNSGTSCSPSSFLSGGIEPHSFSSSNTNLASLSRQTISLAAVGLKPADADGQGDCFFKSVSHQIHGDAAMHFNIRMAGIRYLRDRPERFIYSLANETWGNYINRMSTRGTWCDNLIIQAVANALNCVIHIVSSEIYS